LLRQHGDDVPQRGLEAAAVLFTVLLAFTEIRHAVNAGNIYAAGSGLTEVALQVCVALAMAIGLEHLATRSRSIVHSVAAALLTLFAIVAGFGGLFVLENPAIWPIDVGGEIVNLLLLGYAMPAVLAAILAHVVSGRRAKAWVNVIAGYALILALAYVALEIRRLFHGPVMSRGETTDAEQYAYSLGWLAFGVVLLAVGLVRDIQRARIASAAVIALTILKAFLIDMSSLTGVYRALSFIGLGLVLVAIGWFYQRVLMRRRPAATADLPAGS
jgi:uncharacterized membrane protein